MNSFLYESYENSNSYFSVEPNSVDNEKLHKLHMRFFEKREQLMNYYNNDDYLNDSDNNSFRKSNNNTPSHKSAVSVKEISKMRPGLNLSKTLSDLNNESLNDSIKKSVKSNKSLQKSLSNKSLKDLKKNSNNISKESFDKMGEASFAIGERDFNLSNKANAIITAINSKKGEEHER